MTDEITSPPHYKMHPSGVECITIAQEFNYNLGAAIKYIWRAGLKSGVPIVFDLKKARQYLDFEISRLSENMINMNELTKDVNPKDSISCHHCGNNASKPDTRNLIGYGYTVFKCDYCRKPTITRSAPCQRCRNDAIEFAVFRKDKHNYIVFECFHCNESTTIFEQDYYFKLFEQNWQNKSD